MHDSCLAAITLKSLNSLFEKSVCKMMLLHKHISVSQQDMQNNHLTRFCMCVNLLSFMVFDQVKQNCPTPKNLAFESIVL